MSAVFPTNFSQAPSFQYQGARPQLRTPGAKRGPGLAIVLGLHVLLAWALASGLARKAVEIIKKPIEMAVIQDQPPPPPPPKVEKIKDIPKQQTPPPPAYVPPPEVTPVVTPPAPVITQVQAEAPPRAPVEIAPPAPPAPPPKPAVIKQEIAAACPGYQNVLAQTLEDAFDRVGIAGTVQSLLKVRGSQIVDVQLLSGPPEYYKYVQTAIKRLRCNVTGADEVQVSLPVTFRR